MICYNAELLEDFQSKFMLFVCFEMVKVLVDNYILRLLKLNIAISTIPTLSYNWKREFLVIYIDI